MRIEAVLRRLLPLLLTALLLPACANNSGTSDYAMQDPPPKYTLASFGTAEKEETTINVYDPIEPVNRSIYKFNAMFDRAIFLPVTELYEFLTPYFVQDRVTDFFSNLTELGTFANSILQGKFERASRALVRFTVNSTIGLAGLFDPMTALGTHQEREDFGQTLGVWGVGDGPYLVLPIIGPSNLRDTTGLVTDYAAYQAVDPFGLASFEDDHPEITVLKVLNKRSITKFRYYETGTPFEYDLVRLLYTNWRQLEIEK
jgi:phospholipid-binding lipoprotein MlaA